MLPSYVRQNFGPVAFRAGQHAFRAAPVLKTGVGQMLPPEPLFGSMYPEFPVFETEFHGFVEAYAGFEDTPSYQAARLADTLAEQIQLREGARSIMAIVETECVDVGIKPPDICRSSIERP